MIRNRSRRLGARSTACGYAIYRGITTGLNEAFIIDNETKEALVAEDPRSAEIIKPFLRGKDINRWRATRNREWIIIARFGSHKFLPEQYPAVHMHLRQYEEQLRARGQCRYSRSRAEGSKAEYPGQHHWLELDNNPKDRYLRLFGKEKLFWIDLTDSGRFAYEAEEVFCVNSAYMMAGGPLKYMCAILNSTLVTWFMKKMALDSGMGTTRWVRFTVEQIPVPVINSARHEPFKRAVDEILNAPHSGAEVADWEGVIDALVAELYGLTEEEIRVITDRNSAKEHYVSDSSTALTSRGVRPKRS